MSEERIETLNMLMAINFGILSPSLMSEGWIETSRSSARSDRIHAIESRPHECGHYEPSSSISRFPLLMSDP